MKHIAQLLVDHSVVRTNFKNPFVWTSGIHSPIYCDCRELISIPSARKKIIEGFLQVIAEKKLPHDVISGTATAGIPWAAFVAQELDAPMLYVRGKPKEHGAGKMVEGKVAKGLRILVVEDALSTAGSSIVSADALKEELQASVKDIMAIFTWDTPLSRQNAEKANLTLHPLTNFGEITEALLEAGKITTEEKKSLERFHSNPQEWWKGN